MVHFLILLLSTDVKTNMLYFVLIDQEFYHNSLPCYMIMYASSVLLCKNILCTWVRFFIFIGLHNTLIFVNYASSRQFMMIHTYKYRQELTLIYCPFHATTYSQNEKDDKGNQGTRTCARGGGLSSRGQFHRSN